VALLSFIVLAILFSTAASAALPIFRLIPLDPIVNEQDGAATFTNEWNLADWIADPAPQVRTGYFEGRLNWLATASNPPNQTQYPGVTCFILHDISDLVVREDFDYNTFTIISKYGKVTGWVFNTPNNADAFDYIWIGGSGIGRSFIDDVGYLVRLNDDPRTDRQWLPGGLEPGDQDFRWPDWYGFFGTYGFNNSAWDMGLPNSIDGENEVYEVAFQRPGRETTPPWEPCWVAVVGWCDPNKDGPGHRNIVGWYMVPHVADWERNFGLTTRDGYLFWPSGSTATLRFTLVNSTQTPQVVSLSATGSQPLFPIAPSQIDVTLSPEEVRGIDFQVNIPSGSQFIGVRDTVDVVASQDSVQTSSGTILEVSGPLAQLVLTPQSAHIGYQDSCYFSAFGYDADGRPVHLDELVWTTTQSIGTIEPDSTPHIPELMEYARFQAGGGSWGYVKVSRGSLADSALIYLGDPTSVEPTSVSEEFSISAVEPNPAIGRTNIRFFVKRPARLSLTIVDVTGRQVATILDEQLLPGIHEIEWDGRMSNDRPAPGGVYLCRLSDGRRVSAKMLVLRR